MFLLSLLGRIQQLVCSVYKLLDLLISNVITILSGNHYQKISMSTNFFGLAVQYSMLTSGTKSALLPMDST